ncbi:hypothetical protein L2E82_02562 [Cichorium intybus]|uniref:Uncharacterized protein n=1 Tax=Cichorium intybus TaxID=13427 RepID=A0ACB9H1P1_CICIN|nr:hypothetical protein L2E82_02562 [Cichorium intybus]
MRFPEEESESSPEHEHEHENEREKEEQFDDFEEHNGWNSKVFLQYVLVMIVLILTTLAITSINSPTFSPAREAMLGFMNLYNKGYSTFYRTVGFNFLKVGKLSKREVGVNHDEVWTEDLGDDNMDSNELEGFKTAEIEEVHNSKIDENRDEIWSKNNAGQFQDSQTNKIEVKEEISYESHKPVILKREEIYSRLLGDDSIEVEVNEEPELLKMMVEEDVGKEYILTKLARFDQISVAFVGFCVFLLVSLSIIYYSKKSKISHQNSKNTKNLESFVNSSPLTHKTHSGSLTHSDTVSSNEAKSSYLEFSTNSPSYGSFTIEKTIFKKKSWLLEAKGELCQVGLSGLVTGSVSLAKLFLCMLAMGSSWLRIGRHKAPSGVIVASLPCGEVAQYDRTRLIGHRSPFRPSSLPFLSGGFW